MFRASKPSRGKYLPMKFNIVNISKKDSSSFILKIGEGVPITSFGFNPVITPFYSKVALLIIRDYVTLQMKQIMTFRHIYLELESHLVPPINSSLQFGNI